MTKPFFPITFKAAGLLVLLCSVLLLGCAEGVDAPAKAEFQPLSSDSSSFYYYVSDTRTPLTLSTKWIAVKFASEDPSARSAVLEDSIVDTNGQAEQLTQYGVTLLPVQAGTTFEALVAGINALRSDATFFQVNPVFQSGDTGMIVTDEFIVTFPAGMSMEEIDKVNASYAVEVVKSILGQENTFVLRVTTKTQMDTLSLANLYQESGVARYAAPNFVRVK